MYKLVVFAALLAVVAAAPGLVAPWGHGIVGAPAVVSAPILSAPIVKQAVPVATSYANVNTLRVAAPAVAVAHAPLVAHAPVVAAPLAHGYSHGW
ncbi:larval/pupal cuticle protein H1C-like [Melitaea cinxia]|uniref:larval/pupal cuticle protein H1C-like n=1 Tax=Melitaea cinxia TaxID=113334 RepID=UPI001E26FBC4|nr:larval/pupal cuticle protein H1C-like [Melitaea cinxia]